MRNAPVRKPYRLPRNVEQRLRRLVSKYGLEDCWGDVRASAAPCYAIRSADCVSEAKLGCSRFGGFPDVPRDYPWPQIGGELMAFVAQINLSELPRIDSSLPRQGWLHFFVGRLEATGTESHVHCVSGRAARLRPLSPPAGTRFINEDYLAGAASCLGRKLAIPGVFDPVAIAFEVTASLPPLDPHHPRDVKRFGQWLDLHAELHVTNSRLLGYPYYDLDRFNHGFRKPLSQWRLLLQVDSMEPCDQMLWCDNGMLEFLIRQQHLAARDFSATRACIKGHG